MGIKDPNGRLARWALYIQSFEFEIEYVKGSNHAHVDAVSRPVVDESELKILSLTNFDEPESPKMLDLYNDEAFLHFLKTNIHLPGTSHNQIK
jgi:hypothetical protein